MPSFSYDVHAILALMPLPPPGWEWVVAGSGLPVVHAPPGGDPHADEEATRCGADPGATPGQPGAPPAAAADRACQQQRQALSHCERPDSSVEGGRPRSRDGALLCPAQFPGAPAPLAAHDLIGINSIIEDAFVTAIIDRGEHTEGTVIEFIGGDIPRKIRQGPVQELRVHARLCLFFPQPRPSFGSWQRARTHGGRATGANSPGGRANRLRPRCGPPDRSPGGYNDCPVGPDQRGRR